MPALQGAQHPEAGDRYERHEGGERARAPTRSVNHPSGIRMSEPSRTGTATTASCDALRPPSGLACTQTRCELGGQGAPTAGAPRVFPMSHRQTGLSCRHASVRRHGRRADNRGGYPGISSGNGGGSISVPALEASSREPVQPARFDAPVEPGRDDERSADLPWPAFASLRREVRRQRSLALRPRRASAAGTRRRGGDG